MYHTILLTAGISLFGSFNIFGKKTRTEKIFEFPATNPKAPGEDQETWDSHIEDWLKTMRPLFGDALSNPKRISAEYSALYALQKENKLQKNPKIVLFYTNTFGSKAAARLLEKLIAKDFSAQVSLEKIDDLDVDNRSRLNQNLGNFMQLLGRHLQNQDKSSTCFVPLGGYKIMTSLGYIWTF